MKTVTAAMPMGVRFDSNLTLTENATAAWAQQQATRRAQREHNARVLARRVFRTDEIEFSYLDFEPDTPTFTIDEELVAFYDAQFAVVELCCKCGEHYQLHRFMDLAGFGRAIAVRDSQLVFVCRDCQMEGHKRRERK